jgi:hypothetical protein
MSSFTSSSETADPIVWGRWLGVFLGALALGAAAIFAFVLAIDPYDSGRVGMLGIRGVDDASPRTANASRARDPQFDSAVIGNSTGQLLKPSELSALTGKRFVQLTVPGTGPREQLAIVDFFVRQHPKVGALVVVTDASWCQRDPALRMQHPFPFWLYGDSTLDYVRRLFSTRALRLGLRRIMVGVGLRKRSAPDGYWDYEKEGPAELAPVIASHDDDGGSAPAQVSENFPAVALLDGAIRKLAPDVPVVLVVPPSFAPTLPRPGTFAAAEAQACNGVLRKLVANRPNSNFINYHVDTPLTRDRANFMDLGHYRAPVARKMEQGIAESIRLGANAKIEF